jgi:hypothetical protein
MLPTDHGHYSTREQAKGEVIDSIEMFYNSYRLCCMNQ